MDRFLIKGGTPLHGDVQISGAKNAVLPIMAATLLTAEPCVIRRVPNLSDVHFMAQILQSLGATAKIEGDVLRVQAGKIKGVGDYELIRKMRGSICILGPLLGRTGKALVSLPGGCVIGARRIDLHLKGLKSLGTKIRIENGYVNASARRLKGTELFLGGRSGPTVLGTANVMMAAVLAEGVTIIESAACEPEVIDLGNFLNAMGAKVCGAGSPTITITGVERLHGAEHEAIPDRIETATFAVAAAATGGEVTIRGSRPDHLHAVLDKLREAGVKVALGPALKISRNGKLRAVDITTLPYSGFPTDAQAQMMALMALTPGISIITERIFESRFMHVSELARLGADIAIEGPSAIVKGGQPLSGAPVMASDLRASAALVIAGLAARGTTEVHRVYHIDRGYDNIDGKLRKLGARIERVEGPVRFIIGLIIVVGLALGVYQLYNYWGNFKEKEPVVNAPPPPSYGESLPGMPQRLQPVLEQAQRRGAAGLHDFLNMYGNTISDPRRAWIELDYVVLEAQASPGEVRRQFAKTKSRVQPGSPVYARVKELQKTYD